MVSMISKSKVYRGSDGKLRYKDSLYVPEDVNKFTLTFIIENFFNNFFEDIAGE